MDATALTVFGLPVLTWAVLTTAAIGVRPVTDGELLLRTPGGLSASLALGIVLGGAGAVYLVTAGGYPVLWTTAAYVALTGVTVLWYRFARSSSVAPEEPTA